MNKRLELVLTIAVVVFLIGVLAMVFYYSALHLMKSGGDAKRVCSEFCGERGLCDFQGLPSGEIQCRCYAIKPNICILGYCETGNCDTQVTVFKSNESDDIFGVKI